MSAVDPASFASTAEPVLAVAGLAEPARSPSPEPERDQAVPTSTPEAALESPENPARALIPPETSEVDGILSTLSVRRAGEDLDLVRRAHAYAVKAHEGQRRLSGEPYITHPVAVATIIADLGLDNVAAAAALLHDAVEDTGVTLAQIEAEFGPAVAAGSDSIRKRPSRPRRCARCSWPWRATGGCSS
jgi:GTP pyrophosphokinase